MRISTWPPMVGMHMPISGFFYIFVVGFLWNLLASKTIKSLALNAKELVVVTGMTFMGCFPPTSGLFRYFHRQLILPWYYLSTGGRTEWEKFGVLDHIPGKLFPQPAPEIVDGVLQMDDVVYRGFFTGLAQGNVNIGFQDVPFGAWLPALAYWAPLIILMSVCVMALTLVVHRQWAHHEQLSYPLAQVASSFIASNDDNKVPSLFRNRLFWWGFLPIIIIYAFKYINGWFPDHFPGLDVLLPNVKNWSVNVQGNFPILNRVPTGRYLGWQNIYFSVIGLAYFVSAEISLTMGLSAILLAFVGIWFFLATGTPLSGNDMVFSYAGAYLGYAMILLYTGHSYYIPLFKKALGIVKERKEHDHAAVLAARLLLISFVAFVVLLALMGLDWLVALFFGLLLMLLFLVFTRIICETGIPFMQAGWLPGSLMVSLLGPAAIGPGPMTFIFYLGTILCQDPRESLMPFFATSIKMADDAKLRLTRIFRVLLVSVVIALAVGFVSTAWTNYNFGGMSADGWSFRNVPTMPFDDAARQISILSETGMYETSSAAGGLGKLRLVAPDKGAIGYLGFGLFAVIIFYFLRFRFTRFPLHPVLFLVWGTYPANLCWASFLIGWGIKGLVVRFGGGKVYQTLKPVFVGLIAGELIAAGTSIFIEMIYYWSTGNTSGVPFGILPG